MLKRNLAYLILVAFLANMAFAGGKGNGHPPAQPGFWRGAILGARVLVNRIRARTEPVEEARDLLQQMRQLTNEMRLMRPDLMQEALTRMQGLQRQYLNLIRDYEVNEDALVPRQAARFVEEAQALVERSLASHVTPARRMSGDDYGYDGGAGMSPTAARLSGSLEELAGRAPEPVVDELRPLVMRLLVAQEDAAQRAEQQIQQIEGVVRSLETREHTEEEIMSLRGAVQQILRVLEQGPSTRGEPMFHNDGALLPSMEPNNGNLLESDTEENDGGLLPSDDEE